MLETDIRFGGRSKVRFALRAGQALGRGIAGRNGLLAGRSQPHGYLQP